MYRGKGGSDERELMKYVVRDKKTDQITGIDPKAPATVKAKYNAYMKTVNGKKAINK